VPEKYAKVFRVSAKRAIRRGFILRIFAAGKPLQGWQVDKAARSVSKKRATENIFSIAPATASVRRYIGNGANMDGLEKRTTCVTDPADLQFGRPGIYLPEFGIRSEVNCILTTQTRVTGAVQKEILPLLA